MQWGSACTGSYSSRLAMALADILLLGAGYVAVGFTDVPGKMGPADAYVLFLDPNGVAQCVDTTTGAAHASFPPDAHQDCQALSGLLFNGTLTISFSRLLNTGVCQLPCLVWCPGHYAPGWWSAKQCPP